MKNITFLVGMPGSGKSSVGALLAEQLGATFVDLDEAIVSEEGKPIAQIFEQSGEDYFRELEAKMLRQVAEKADESVMIACGGGTPCFHDNMTFINERGFCVFLNANKWILAKRLIGKGQKRPLLTGKREVDLVNWLENTYLQRLPYYHMADMEVDTTLMTIEEQVDILSTLIE